MMCTLIAPLCLAVAPAVEITGDTVLDPAKTYGPLVIKASNITIDGRGAVTRYFPPGGTDPSTLREGRGRLIDASVVLDDAPSFERFFLCAGDAAKDALEAMFSSDAAPGQQQAAQLGGRITSFGSEGGGGGGGGGYGAPGGLEVK